MRALLLVVAAPLLAFSASAAEVEGRAGVGLGGLAVTGYATPTNTPRGMSVTDPRTGLPRELGQTWLTVSPALAGLLVWQPWESLDIRVGIALGDAAYPTFSRDVERWGVINVTTLAGVLRLGPVGFELGGGLDVRLLAGRHWHRRLHGLSIASATSATATADYDWRSR